MSLVPTLNISYQPVVEEPGDHPQAPRLIGPNSEQLRNPHLPTSPTAAEKKEGDKNPRGERLIRNIRTRQARALGRRREQKRRRREDEVHGCLLLAV